MMVGGDNNMLTKTILAILFGSFTLNVIAATQSVDLEAVKKKIFKQQLEAAGFSENDPPVKILPRGTSLPLYPGLEDTSEVRESSKKLRMQLAKNKREQELYGYHTEETTRPRELLQLHKIIHLEYEAQANGSIGKHPLDTHMKHTVDEVGIAYNFKPVPLKDVTNLIGFAAVGGHVPAGWGGVSEFFDHTSIGSCVYTENNVQLSHAMAQFTEDEITHDVNGKVTTLDVRGTKTSGFLYTIDWYDEHFFRQLQCANMKYSKNITRAVVALATRIDNQ